MTVLEHPIALGRSAEIYEWDTGQVLKLFLASTPPEWAEAEASIGRMVYAAGLPVPAVHGIVEVNGRRGLVLERVDGPSLLNMLTTRPWTAIRYARVLAKMHAEIHACEAPCDLLQQREWIVGVCQVTKALPAKLREQVLVVLDGLPDGHQLCHGDFHPGNIIMAKRGPVIIDWLGAHRGSPVGDVARSSVILSVRATPHGTPGRWLVELLRKRFRTSYLEHYFRLSPEGQEQFMAWQSIMAASFLKWVTPGERPALIEVIKKGVALSRY